MACRPCPKCSEVRGLRSVLVAVASLVVALGCGAPALAAPQAWWHLVVGARPSVLAPGVTGEVVLTAENVGDARAVGTVTVTGSLPAGWTVVGVAGSAPKPGGAPGETVAMACASVPAISW